jgi:hypothetical protein
MKSTDLTKDQAEAHKDRIAPMLAYLHRLKAPTDERDLLPDNRVACRPSGVVVR